MVYMYHSFLIHSSADGRLGCFHVLAMINSAAMNTEVHVSLSDLVSLVCMPRSGIAGRFFSNRATREAWNPGKPGKPIILKEWVSIKHDKYQAMWEHDLHISFQSIQIYYFISKYDLVP